jgi:superfamily II DNA helicase RecQ
MKEHIHRPNNSGITIIVSPFISLMKAREQFNCNDLGLREREG